MGGHGSGRRAGIGNFFSTPRSNVQFTEGQKSKGILDDYAVRLNIDTNEGTVQKAPANTKDIVNKEYIDAGGTGDIWVEKAGDTMTGDLIMADEQFIFTGTSDGADNESTGIAGGGALSSIRGSFVRVSGNEDTNTGKLFLTAGNVNDGEIRFSTGGSQRVVIDDAGLVGIGLSTPLKDLHISSAVPTIRLSDSDASTDQQVATLTEMYRGDNTNRVGFYGMGSSSNDQLVIGTDYAAGEISIRTGANAVAMVINSSGNIDFQDGNLKTTGNISGASLNIGVDSITASSMSGALLVVFDGGGSVIASGAQIDLRVPYHCTLNRFSLLADQSGAAHVMVWKDSLANFPPVEADDISGNGLAITADDNGVDTSLTGWTTALVAGDILRFNMSGASSTITKVTAELEVTKT